MYTRINQCQDHKINFRDKMKKNQWLVMAVVCNTNEIFCKNLIAGNFRWDRHVTPSNKPKLNKWLSLNKYTYGRGVARGGPGGPEPPGFKMLSNTPL